MANTSPDNIYYPVDADAVADLDNEFKKLAESTQLALATRAVRTYKKADLTALSSTSGMTTDDLAVVAEGGAIYRFAGTGWVQVTPARFASASARDTAYAKASAAYRVADAQVLRTDLNRIETYLPANRYHPTLAGWYYPGQPVAASITAGWTGNITWSRVGGLVQVAIGLTRTGGNLSFAAWQEVQIGTGLPLPVSPSNGQHMGLGFTNQTNEINWALSVNNSDVRIINRWSPNTFNTNGWLHGNFTYTAA